MDSTPGEKMIPPSGVQAWEWAKSGQVRIIGERNHRGGKNPPLGAAFFRRSVVQETSSTVTPVYMDSKFKDATAEDCGFVRPETQLLGTLRATSICANDISSSILYTGGLVIWRAGYLAPACFVLVVLVLNLFRPIYLEVVSALPLNGGTYTAMINIARKKYACLAGTLSIISYIATVVTSGASAMGYLQGGLWPAMNVELASIVVFLLFACLMLVGVKESSLVSLFCFTLHTCTLSIMVVGSVVYGFQDGWKNLVENYHHPLPHPPFTALVFGFSQAMLGISGFETSANFVEEQKKGVFGNTLLIMWGVSGFFNTALAVLAFAVIPRDVLYNVHGEVSGEVKNLFLSVMADQLKPMLGSWIGPLVIVDAVLVLCGAVMTGYVGVTGLMMRMVSDDALPATLDRTLCTGANYPVPILFFLVCTSLYAMTGGKVESISGVYVVAFLCVMTMFGLSNLVMKQTRRGLKRDTRARWYMVLLAIGAVFAALAGNIIMEPVIVGYFAVYFSAFAFLILLTYSRGFLLRKMIQLVEPLAREKQLWMKLRDWLIRLLEHVERAPVVFFSKRLDLRELNDAVRYIGENELTRYIKVIHVIDEEKRNSRSQMRDPQQLVEVLQEMYPTMRVDVFVVEGSLCPGFVRYTEELTGVKAKRMLMASPGADFRYSLAQLGGMRIIMNRRHDTGVLESKICLLIQEEENEEGEKERENDNEDEPQEVTDIQIV